ncbi:MAG: TrkA family potassium uptake protein [Bacteroidales bacterium]
MKYIIIGLGNFGTSLGEKLTQMGHEVIGVDTRMGRVEALKERLTHTICLDCTDQQAVDSLPIRDTDAIIVSIGEDEGANLMTTALMKQLAVKRLISRAISPLHETILTAMGVDEIVHPEEETAIRWAKKLTMKGIVDSYELTGQYNIVEAKIPKRYFGKTLEEIGLLRNYGVLVLATITLSEEKSLIGKARTVTKVNGVASSKTVLNENEMMVLFGNINDIQNLLSEE